MQHIRQFAKQHNLTYWEAVKSPKCKTTYGKGITPDLFKDVKDYQFKMKGINPEKQGYKWDSLYRKYRNNFGQIVD